jgi:hypothetical protein
MNMSNNHIAGILDAHHNSVDKWINTYKSGGSSELTKLHYKLRTSELEAYAETIKSIISFSVFSRSEYYRTIMAIYKKKKILYGKYDDTPQKFHNAIRDFFDTANDKFQRDSVNLLTLNFQFFDDFNAQNYAA